MLKTVKVKKKFRLDELIKYIFNNDIAGKRFEERSDYKSYSITHAVHVTGEGAVNVEGLFNPDTKFTVEVEEEITDDTVFKSALVVHHGEELELYENLSIKGFKLRWPNSLQMYALINGKLELIWEAK